LFQVGPSHLPTDIKKFIENAIERRMNKHMPPMPALHDILQFSPPLMEERELEEEEEESENSDLDDCIVIGQIISHHITKPI
jgi:hypothetical protein